MRKKRIAAAAVCAAALSALVWAGAARDQAKPKPMAPGGQWTVHSQERPRPPVIVPPTASTPEQPGQPPSDAIVLFDGTNLSEWEGWAKRAKPPAVIEPGWKIQNGYMEVVPGSGDLQSKREFGDSQIHVEWATPAEVKGDGQGRGNSGFFLLGICEIQVLDSYGNDTYPDGQAGGLYGIYPPLVNASRKPGEWQTYDIIYHGPEFEGETMAAPAKLTVLHNGIAIHHAANPGTQNKSFRIALQDHNNPVRYRNIWVRELKPYDSSQ